MSGKLFIRSGRCFTAVATLIFSVFVSNTSLASGSSDLRQLVEHMDSDISLNPYTLFHPEQVSKIYHKHQHKRLWSGSQQADLRLKDLIRAIKESTKHGFNAGIYHLADLQSNNTSALEKDLKASDAFIAQAIHRKNGVVIPSDIDPTWFLALDEIDPPQLLTQALEENKVFEILEAQWPQNKEYQLLVRKRLELTELDSATTEAITVGAALKYGMREERVIALKKRLFGPGDYSTEFDNDLRDAVKAFQLASGLEPDGIVGSDTLEELNSTKFSWIERIDANLERWRWLPESSPPTYLRVNIATFQLRGFNQGEETLSMPVIVGKPYRQTPVFSETLKYVVYNPYWNLPRSIASKDKLPLLKTNVKALVNQGYEVFSPELNSYVAVDQIDWQGVTRANFNFLMRQKPGPKNALGRMKFMLPNTHAIYLHDTPDHSLFAKRERSFSSGCIRLSNPVRLMEWVLSTDGQAKNIAEIEADLGKEQTQTMHLKKPIPVLIVYFTAFADENENIIFRRDLYQRDKPIVAKLRGV